MPEGLKLRPSPASGREDAHRASWHVRPSTIQAGLDAAWPFTAADVQVLRFAAGDTLVRAGDRLDGIYGLRTGSCKVVLSTAGGDEHIAACRIAGELLGLEALAAGVHEASVEALEPTEVWRLPPERLHVLMAGDPAFAAWLARALAESVAASLRAMLLLGALTAEQRVASCLLDFAARCGRPGPPRHAIVLRMTRAEMGRHLGLSTETVSRAMSRFASLGWIAVDGRCVDLTAPQALQDLLAQSR